MLTAAEHEHRRNKFTGSLAPPVMTLTDPAELNRRARIKAEGSEVTAIKRLA